MSALGWKSIHVVKVIILGSGIGDPSSNPV